MLFVHPQVSKKRHIGNQFACDSHVLVMWYSCDSHMLFVHPQVSKKRHIGNDLVAVVFLEDEDTVFSPSLIQSHFLHSYIVVQLVKGSSLLAPKYRVSVLVPVM